MTYVAGVPLLRPRTNGPTGSASVAAPFLRNIEATGFSGRKGRHDLPANTSLRVQAIRHAALN